MLWNRIGCCPERLSNYRVSLHLDDGTGVLIHPDGSRYYVCDDNTVDVFDLATDTPVDVDNDGGNGVTSVSLAEQIRAHFMCISPF